MTRRGSDTVAWLVLFAAAAVVGLIVLGACVLYSTAACGWKTSGMTLPHRYKFGAGCQVRTLDAGWVGLEHFRVLR